MWHFAEVWLNAGHRFMTKHTLFLLNKKEVEDFPFIIFGELWKQMQEPSLNNACFPGMDKPDISWYDH